MSTMSTSDSPPRAPPIKYDTPLGTRWQKEKAAAGTGAFDYPEDARFVGPWIIGECVGKGASGHVKIAKHRKTGQLAAVKILPLQPFKTSRASLASQAKSDKQRLGIDREIIMMKLMNHPNIMRIYDVYEGEKELYLILEYVEGGELFDFLVNRGKLPPLEALAYFKQIVYGLNYAHTFSIIHRDLKPENILIHSLNPPLIKIADWGMAAFAPPSLQLETSCGSPHYASPEIVNGHKYRGTATDIWSCGVILYALLTGRLPFDDKNVRTLLNKVKVGKYEMPAYIDPLAKDLLSRMLVVDVAKRISMAEILAHPWLEGSTPGITYVLAPSVDELAEPLASALLVDPDIFECLCVIWGRHADVDGIKADLLSPAGQGNLAKAFYFLLRKHRERTMEEHGILMDTEEVLTASGKVVTKQYSAPRSRKSVFLDVREAVHSLVHQEHTSHVHLQQPLRPVSTSSAKALTISTDMVVDRAQSRSHPPSPVGPRPQRPRPVSGLSSGDRSSYIAPLSVITPLASQAHTEEHAVSASSTAAVASAPNSPMQGQVHAAPAVSSPSVAGRRSSMLVSPGMPVEHIRSRRDSVVMSSPTPPAAGVIHAPIPVHAASASAMPLVHSPKAPEAELQKNVDQAANVMSMKISPWNALRSQQTQSMDYSTISRDRSAVRDDMGMPPPAAIASHVRAESSRYEGNGGNKENLDRSIVNRRMSDTGGLGFGHSVPMAKEMGNMVFFNEAGAKGSASSKKDRKSRPSGLDLAGTPLLQKRSTFSMMGSPTLMSPPGSLLGSPVGEFKGWFSNLFHWKAQSYLLYSINDLRATRMETIRLMEQLGVLVLPEDHQGWCVLRCRLDDVHDGPALVQKQMRFRIELHSGSHSSSAGGSSTGSYGTQPGATPRLSQLSMSPHIASFVGIRSGSNGGRSSEKPSAYETSVGLVLEKGSVSTFKMLYHRIRCEWRLDTLQSPRTSTYGTVNTPGIEQRFTA